jgi:hypothetical protein
VPKNEQRIRKAWPMARSASGHAFHADRSAQPPQIGQLPQQSALRPAPCTQTSSEVLAGDVAGRARASLRPPRSKPSRRQQSGSIPRGFQEDKNMRSVALWLLGVPIGVIILLNVFGLLGH